MSLLNRFKPSWLDKLGKYRSEVAKINALADEIAGLTQEQIQTEILDFKKSLSQITDDKTLWAELRKIRPRVYALTREAAKRSLGQFHYDVQLIGGLALSETKIAEMRTGEGKTLTATLPLVLFSLAGRGAHLVTVNDYLARWQASQMGHLFHYLGLSIASIQQEQSFLYDPTFQPSDDEVQVIESAVQGLVLDVKHMRPIARKEAYACDITYGTNTEIGFDYLRDNMAQSVDNLVQRPLFFAIVDEVDSILIDEARTPLIISQPDMDATDKYVEFSKIVGKLQAEEHYTVDEKYKAASLTDEGINKLEEILKVQNIYDTAAGVQTLHHIEQALKAKTLFHKDRDYVIRDGEVVIVDEFTGRLMFGRRYSEGLHQAIEAKEGVKIQQESRTLGTITFQNLFRLYTKLAGMTGTGKTEEEEFFKIYRLEVVTIPTHKPMVRVDQSDVIYKTEAAKYTAIVEEVRKRHMAGQPVLIGTVSVVKNEELAKMLKKAGLPFEILNAKNHEREAQIIAQAGAYKAITVATNIAGRGVDILLGGNPVDPVEAEKVRAAGGLHVIGTERHESRRIDNQLRGRSGRQGDPGSSQFFISMEDDLMRIFGGDQMKRLMTALKLPDDQPLEARLVSRSIESSQKRIEGQNFDQRKRVLEFDDVMNHQRNIIFRKRRNYLVNITPEDCEAEVVKTIEEQMTAMVKQIFNGAVDESDRLREIVNSANLVLPNTDGLEGKLKAAMANAADAEFAVLDVLLAEVKSVLAENTEKVGVERYREFFRFLLLNTIDRYWMDHIDTMAQLRDSVSLRGYAQREPLVEYKREGYELFQRLLKDISQSVAFSALKLAE